jgi:hypothetical protein
MPNPPRRTKSQDEYAKLTVRLPRDLYEHLSREASRHGQSLNAHIVTRLRENELGQIRSELDDVNSTLRKILDAVT